MIALLSLLACGTGDPPPNPTPPEEDAIGLTPAVRDDLALVPRLVGLAAKSDEDACAAVAHLLDLVPRLDQQLDARKEEGAPLSPALEQLADTPGLLVRDGAETVHAAVDWTELARAVGPGPTANAFVSVGAILTTRPVWARPLSDVTACADHAAVQPWLVRLGPSLERAPACLVEVVRAPLEQALGAMADHACLCAPADEARAEATETAFQLRRLRVIDGEALASRLEQTLTHATFDGVCGG